MTRERSLVARQDGVALIYIAVTLTALLLFTGLAVDGGGGYVVKAALSKAVDGAALAAARELNSGTPMQKAQQVFKANFPQGFLGTSSVTDPTTDTNFYQMTTDSATGVNIITINAQAVLPTTFMNLAGFTNMTVSASGQATRRMVDLSLVLDVSSSIGSQWPTVRDAARTFINAFDAAHDRLSLLTFSNGANVLYAMPSTRGFDKTGMISAVPNTLPGGSTLMVEGLYRGWDELRSVPTGSQSSLRIIVLFTDGASNGVPGNWDGSGHSCSLRTYDFPKNAVDPDGQTWDSPYISGLYDSQTGDGVCSSPYSQQYPWNSINVLVPPAPAYLDLMPLTTLHTHHRSAGIPTSFPFQTNSLTVNGAPQQSVRGLRNFNSAAGRYPAEIHNINNAARNVLEIIADSARNDSGDYKVRIYTIGMSYLVTDSLGTMPEMPQDILKRIANDKSSPDFNSGQLEGKYFHAQTAADVGSAFEGIQNQILRLSK
jgi:Flp pilus assembly protein TadG